MSESKMVPAPGIKELREVTEAILELALRMVGVLKDGYQPTDLALIFEVFTKDEIMKKKLTAAYDGISKVGTELKSMHAQEIVELSIALLQFVPKFIEVLAKKEK